MIFRFGCCTFITGFFLFFHLLEDIVDFPFLGVTLSLLDFSSSSICLRILLIFRFGCYTFITGFLLFVHLLEDIVDFPFLVLHFHYWIFPLLVDFPFWVLHFHYWIFPLLPFA